MSLLVLSDGTRVAWEPTTDLVCLYCREPIDVGGQPRHSLAWTNFMFDLLHPKETSLIHGGYWYLHKKCMGIEDALMARGAKIGWGWYDMKSVLGLDGTTWKQMCGDVQKMLRKRMPPGVYEKLYEQWLPAISRPKVARAQMTKPEPKPRLVKPPKPPKPARTGKPGYAYLIEAVGSGRIKIGHGASAQVRLTQLGTGTPFPLRLLHAIPAEDSYALEQALQARYVAYNVWKEWYILPADVLAALLQEDFS